METSLEDRNYKSEIQVKSVTSTNPTKVPYEGHIPSAYFPAQDKILFPICLSLFSNCQHCKAIQLWVKQLCDILPSTSSTKLSAQFFFITGTDGIECQGLRADLCPLTLCFSGPLFGTSLFANLSLPHILFAFFLCLFFFLLSFRKIMFMIQF